jgi:DUF971 family protein
MPSRLQLVNLAVVGDELALAWSDGEESFFGLEELRRLCPCAVCQGEADVLGRVDRPRVQYSPSSFVLKRCAPVGGYALQPLWSDGHDSGLYTYRYLRALRGWDVESKGQGDGETEE